MFIMNYNNKGILLQSPLQQNTRFQQAESNTVKLSGAQEDLIWVCLHLIKQKHSHQRFAQDKNMLY